MVYCVSKRVMRSLELELEDLSWKQKEAMWGGILYDRSAWMVRGVPVVAW